MFLSNENKFQCHSGTEQCSKLKSSETLSSGFGILPRTIWCFCVGHQCRSVLSNSPIIFVCSTGKISKNAAYEMELDANGATTNISEVA